MSDHPDEAPTEALTPAEYELMHNERLHADVLASMGHIEQATPRVRRGDLDRPARG